MNKELTKVTITLETVNATFEEEGKIEEVKRILLEMLESYNFNNENDCMLRDINGNMIGEYQFTHE